MFYDFIINFNQHNTKFEVILNFEVRVDVQSKKLIAQKENIRVPEIEAPHKPDNPYKK